MFDKIAGEMRYEYAVMKFFYTHSFFPAISLNILCYFNIFQEFKVPKKVITTEIFNVDWY